MGFPATLLSFWVDVSEVAGKPMLCAMTAANCVEIEAMAPDQLRTLVDLSLAAAFAAGTAIGQEGAA
jgi:hypothetical protein